MGHASLDGSDCGCSLMYAYITKGLSLIPHRIRHPIKGNFLIARVFHLRSHLTSWARHTWRYYPGLLSEICLTEPGGDMP